MQKRQKEYDPGSQAARHYEEELKGIRKKLSHVFSAIIHDAQDLLISTYAYFSPFAAVFGTSYSMGHREEDERFRINFKDKVFDEIIKYKKRLEQFEAETAEHGYSVKKETADSVKERRTILATCPEAELRHWKEVSQKAGK